MSRILITGANRGIGLALVRHAVGRGHFVFAACRSPGAATELHALGTKYPDTLRIVRIDLLDPITHARAAEEIRAQAGALDVLINNAGIYIRDPRVAPEKTHRSIRLFNATSTLELLRINAVAPLEITRTLLPLLLRVDHLDKKLPRIAFISSGMASIGGKNGAEIEYGYSGSKAALNMFARVLAQELASHGILVALLSPGWVATDMGTSHAPLQPAVVAEGLFNVIDALDPATSGSFLTWQGQPLPW